MNDVLSDRSLQNHIAEVSISLENEMPDIFNEVFHILLDAF